LMGAIFDKIEPERTPRRRNWQEIDSAIPSPAARPITQAPASIGSVPSASGDSGQQAQGTPRRVA
jgi:hypothetical protein